MMRYLLLSVLVVCMIGIMIPNAFADHYELNDFKKFLPDYYNYIPEASKDKYGIVDVLVATIDKGDGIGGQVSFQMSTVDPDLMWRQYDRFEDGYYDTRDHLPDLPPTSCFEGWAQDYLHKVVVCMKDNVMIMVMTNDGEHRSTMKQILNKMDGQLTLPDIEGGGCLIATATFGSEMAPQVQFLRELRDNTVLQTESGTSFMAGFNQFYYSFSPAVADYERENPVFKEAVKITLTPLLTSLTLLQYTDIDSESEMLGYGIGVILLNIGMYFVAPAVVIMAVRKRI